MGYDSRENVRCKFIIPQLERSSSLAVEKQKGPVYAYIGISQCMPVYAHMPGIHRSARVGCLA